MILALTLISTFTLLILARHLITRLSKNGSQERWRLTTFVLILLVSGCSPEPTPDVYINDPRPELFRGDIATIKISGEQVMVLGSFSKQQCSYVDGRYQYWTYWIVECRVAAPGQVRRDGLVSRDTTIDTYRRVQFFPFELKRNDTALGS